METKVTLIGEQRQHWQYQAAYWGVVQEDAIDAGEPCEFATEQRLNALRMLGMIASEV